MKAYNQHINNLINRYVQGEIDASQLRELNDFIEQNDENRQYVLNMREMVFYDECTNPITPSMWSKPCSDFMPMCARWQSKKSRPNANE